MIFNWKLSNLNNQQIKHWRDKKKHLFQEEKVNFFMAFALIIFKWIVQKIHLFIRFAAAEKSKFYVNSVFSFERMFCLVLE